MKGELASKLEKEVIKALDKENLEYVSGTATTKEGVVEVKANHLEPITTDSGLIYIPVPVNIKVPFTKQNRVIKIARPDVSPAVLADARNFGKMLIANKQLALPGQSHTSSTHVIEVNAKGQHVIRRKRFTSF